MWSQTYTKITSTRSTVSDVHNQTQRKPATCTFVMSNKTDFVKVMLPPPRKDRPTVQGRQTCRIKADTQTQAQAHVFGWRGTGLAHDGAFWSEQNVAQRPTSREIPAGKPDVPSKMIRYSYTRGIRLTTCTLSQARKHTVFLQRNFLWDDLPIT